MNKTSVEDRASVINCLIEGNSVNSTVRLTGIAKTTILRLIIQLADACQELHDERVQGLTTREIQMDEVWAFVGAKEKNTSHAKKFVEKWGDTWTWTAIDATSKLMIGWFIGPRDITSARPFVSDVASRLTHRVQLTTDGLRSYLRAVDEAFGDDIDYAMLVKVYGPDRSTPVRYSPPMLQAVTREVKSGNPELSDISTSFVERSNLTVRMGMRRYTRLTNGHSKKFLNHVAMTAIFFTHYNWCRVHSSLKITPAMKAGLTDRVWNVEDLLSLLK